MFKEQQHLPILCKLWSEDGVWNAIAADLPVAVFGATFEEAKENLEEALNDHIKALRKTGHIQDTIELLTHKAHEYGFLSFDDIGPDSALVKMLVSVQGQEHHAQV